MTLHSPDREPRTAREARALIRVLEAENSRLHSEVEFLRGNPAIAKGMKGESLVAELVSARRSKRGASHDLESSGGEVLLEVKYSSLLNVISGRPIQRWVWTKLFGELGRKQYDHLLLVGDADPRFSSSYADPSSPYVLFELPYEVAVELAGGIKPGRYSSIHLTTNPRTVKSVRAQALFQNYQVSISELKRRYAYLEAV